MFRHGYGHADGISEALFALRVDHQTVDNEFNGVAFVAFDLHLFFHLPVFSVNAYAEKSFEEEAFEKLSVVPFASCDEGREDLHFCTVWQGENGFADGTFALLLEHGTGDGVVAPSGLGVEEADKVVNFGDGADC